MTCSRANDCLRLERRAQTVDLGFGLAPHDVAIAVALFRHEQRAAGHLDQALERGVGLGQQVVRRTEADRDRNRLA
jgi:hypothetical protein